MPDKLTDKEIKKALEICSTYKGKCTDCPAFVKVDRSNCKKVLLGAVEIINRLQAENEKLDRTVKEYAYLYDKHINTPFNHIKAEAYKEFAERLKERKYQSSDWSHGEHPFVVEESDIDDTLYELVGDEK